MSRIGFFLLVGVGLFGPLFYGSVGTVSSAVLSAIIAAAVYCALLSERSVPKTPLFAGLLIICIFLTGVAIFQAMPIWVGYPSHRIWGAAGQIVDVDRAPVSVAAWRPIQAYGHVISPPLAFLAGAILVRDEERLRQLWTTLVVVGFALLIVTLAQHAVAPAWLLIARKEFYLDSFTGPFVNRNTAATYFGTLAIMALALAYRTSRRLTWRLVFDTARRSSMAWREIRTTAQFAAASALFAFAVVLTSSRAGFVLLALTGGALFAWMLGRRLAGDRRKLVFALAVLAILLAAFTGRILLRFSLKPAADDLRWCTYEATWRAFLDSLWFGTGLGTFSDIFPLYRSCDSWGTWSMAHSTYLEGLLSIGVIFVPLAIVLHWIVFAVFIRGTREPRTRYLAMACLAIASFVCLHAVVDFSMQIPGFAAFVAVVLGAGAGALRPAETANAKERLAAQSLV